MTKLHISPSLSLPIEAVTEAIGFIGRRGSGKSYAAQKLAEEFHRAKAQFVALDPVGNWYGLRLAADGKSPGIPVTVFGGLQGDLPINASSGKEIADAVVDYGISAVIDVSQFESDADKARFARAFCERFYFRKKSAPSAVHLFLEEAQEFIPQNPGRDEAHMLHAFTRLAKLGRNFGIGVSMLSQRPQEVNKKVLNLTELLFVFQLTGTHERKAVEAWIGDKGLDEDIQAELPKLERGNPHVWSPAWLQVSRVLEIGQKWTFDASSTPKVGAGAAVVRELSPIDVDKLRKDLSVSIEKAKADDPKELKREIASLKSQLKGASTAPQNSGKKGPPVVDQAAIDRAVAAALAAQEKTLRAEATRRVQVAKGMRTIFDTASRQLVSIAEALGHGSTQLQTWLDSPPSSNGHGAGVPDRSPPPPKSVTTSVVPATRLARRDLADTADSSGLGKTPRRMIEALAQLATLGVDTPSRENVAGWVGISANTGTFRNYLSDLRTVGAIEDLSDGRMRLTAHGLSMASGIQPVESLSALHDIWRKKLGSTPARMFDVLIEAYPEPMTREALAAAVGIDHTTGTFRNYLSDLRSPGIMADVGKTAVVASELLFPPGLS